MPMKTINSRTKTATAVLAALTLATAAIAQTAPNHPIAPATPPATPATTTPNHPAASPNGEGGGSTQTMGAPLPGGSGLPPAPQVRQTGNVEYMNGGAGEEARQAMDAKKGQFSLHNVFSGKGGEYVVARKVTIRPDGAPAAAPITIDNAGPILMVSLPPGSYTVEADVDGKMQRKTVKLAGQPVKLNWNWPGA